MPTLPFATWLHDPMPRSVRDADGRLGPPVQWATAELTRHSPRMLAEAARSVLMHQAGEWMTDVDVPTAVVVTTRDRSVPPAMQLRMAESIRHSTVHLVDGGHSVCVRERFVEPLLDACSTVASRAPV